MKLSQHETLWLKSTGADMLRELGVKEGNSVIDFGSGEGRYTTPLSQVVGTTGTIFAVERNKEPIEALQKRVAQFSDPKIVTLLNTEDLDKTETIPKESIDAIFIYDVLQYVEDWDSLFFYFFTLLKFGGIVSVYPAAVPHPGDIDIKLVRSKMEKIGFTYIKENSFNMMHNIDMVDDIVYSFNKTPL